MTDNRHLSTLACSIRRAVGTGAYDEADRLLASYCEHLPACRDEMAEELRRTMDMLDWMFRMVSAAKAHDSAQLTGLLRTGRYRRAEMDHDHSWQLEG